MAFKDASGRITIDEQTAQQDIQRLNQAIESLNNAKRTVTALANQAENEKGETALAIQEKAAELKGQLDKMIGRLNETAAFIRQTVNHYREVDRQVKEAIQRAQIATSSGGGGSFGPSGSTGSRTTAATTASAKSTTKSSTPAKTTSAKTTSTKKSTKKDSIVDDVADAFSEFFNLFK